jgi:glycerate dehydrogenase
MKIVILDGYTMNPGDLSWEPFYELGEVAYFDRTPKELTPERIGQAEIVLTNKVVVNREIIESAPNIRFIGVLATGYDVVDVAVAREKNICVSNIPSYSSSSVAQLVFAHLLAHCNRVEHHDAYIKNGGWCRSAYDSFFITPQTELAGKTLGVVGYGNIGSKVAQIALGFGMKVLISNRSVKTGLPEGITQVPIEDLFRESDVVSLHCPLTENTLRFVNRSLIGLMKKSALLINTSRGKLIEEDDLALALNNGDIAGASLDVLSVEPPDPDNPLLSAKNCILTSHLGWSTYEARSRLMDMALENVKAFLGGNPINLV